MTTEIGQTSIPEWDGQLVTFKDFEENCYWYVRGLRRQDRPLAVPRIIRRLPKAPRQLVRQLNKHKLAARSGLNYLLHMIQTKLLVPQVQDVGRYISAYFEHLSCRRGESIQEFVTRERLVYLDMCRAVKALNTDQPPQKIPSAKSSQRGETEDEEWAGDDDFGDIWPNQDGDRQSVEERGRSGKGKGTGNRTSSVKSEWSIVSDENEFELDNTDHTELLPDQIQGFFLLRKAGLTKTEEQQVLAAAGNSLRRTDIEASLRALFWDKRPQIAPKHGHFGDNWDADGYEAEWDYGEDQWDDSASLGFKGFRGKGSKGRRSATPDDACFLCGDRGHFSRDCPHRRPGFHASTISDADSNWGSEAWSWDNAEWETESQWDWEAEADDGPIEFEDEEERSAYLAAADQLKEAFMQQRKAGRTLTQARALMRDIKTNLGFQSKGKGKGFGKNLGAAVLGKGKGGKGKGKGKPKGGFEATMSFVAMRNANYPAY